MDQLGLKGTADREGVTDQLSQVRVEAHDARQLVRLEKQITLQCIIRAPPRTLTGESVDSSHTLPPTPEAFFPAQHEVGAIERACSTRKNPQPFIWQHFPILGWPPRQSRQA